MQYVHCQRNMFTAASIRYSKQILFYNFFTQLAMLLSYLTLKFSFLFVASFIVNHLLTFNCNKTCYLDA